MPSQAEIRGFSKIWGRLTGARAGSESSIRTAPSQADQRSTRNKTATASASDPLAKVSLSRQAVPNVQITPPDDSVGIIGGTVVAGASLDPVNKTVLNKWATDYENLGKDIVRIGNLNGVDPLVSGEIQNEITADLQRFKKNLGL